MKKRAPPRGRPFVWPKMKHGPTLATRRAMDQRRIAFAVGLLVTIVTTLAHPGGAFGSFVVGTSSGVLAVGVMTFLLRRRG